MSTYLVYLGIGPFDVASTADQGRRVSVATAPGKAPEAERALRMAGPIVRAYEEYYRLPYPLPKLDLIAVPDFWAGGMENWGAITFPEIGLLWGEATSPSVLRWAIETLSHEIAHQWFGNLVTMEWWTDIWLNESFATFVAAKMQDRLHLRADAWAEFLIRASPGYFADSLRSTHPVKFEVRDPSEISQNVDDITYFKGANIVRMIEGYLGEETFQRGVSAYLSRFQFGNARGEDLWAALEEASGQPVRSVMSAWIERPGLPVVEVRIRGGAIHLSQRRFSFLPVSDPPAAWPIPLTLAVDGAAQRVYLESPTLDVPCRSPEGVVVNPGRRAFIRVWYDAETRTRLLARLPALAPLDRWAFLSDSLAFLLAEDITLEDFLNAVRAARGSSDYPSVIETLGGLHLLRPFLGDVPAFRKAYTDFHRAQLVRLTLEDREGEPDSDPIVRQAAATGLAHMDPEFARSFAGGYHEMAKVPVSLRAAVATAFARQGGPGVLDTLFAQIRSLESDDAAERAAFALGALPTEALLAEALDRLRAPGVRTTHICYIVRSIAANPLGRRAAWDWLTANLRDYEKRAEGSWWLSNLLASTIPTVGLGREPEVTAFFEREKFPEGSNGVRRGLEMLEVMGKVRRRARSTP
ncbi:MAG: M1 family aminopeptidase [Thermoplasmata archaeon]